MDSIGRSDYTRGELHREDMHDDPFVTFAQWIEVARNSEIQEPDAMCVSTVNRTGRPSLRMVLLRGFSDRGLVFYTNTESRKAEDIARNPHASAVFWWAKLERQIRVEGVVEIVERKEAEVYFASRPRLSQIGAHASPQSQVIEGREVLDEAMLRVEAEYPDAVPMPDNWGGYRIVPDYFEFWQGRRARTHDRFRYTKSDKGWQIDRLAP